MKRILGIDFETANRYRDSACSVGLFLKENNKVLYSEEILINPETNFDFYNTLVHNITPSMVKNAVKFPKVAKIIDELIGDFNQTLVVAHNASFDISVYKKSCQKYNIDVNNFDYYCTLKMAKNLIKDINSYSLDSLASYFNLPAFNHHNALADAKTAVYLYEKLENL